MKKLLWPVALMLCLAGCTQNEESKSSDSPVRFQSVLKERIITRAGNSTFKNGEQIGVYMYKEDARTAGNSVKYVVRNGNLVCPIYDQAYRFPVDNSAVLFKAYAPYDETVSDSYKIDLKADDEGKKDLLFAQSKEYRYKDQETVKLSFQHILSKVVLNIKSSKVDLSSLQVNLTDMPYKADFSLNEGQLNVAGDKSVLNSKNIASKVEFLLFPGEVSSDAKLIFRTVEGYWQEIKFPLTKMEPNTEYDFNVSLYKQTVEIGNVSITDWKKGEVGNADLEVSLNSIDPTKADPRPAPAHYNGKSLKWSDEFNAIKGSAPNPEIWTFEKGFTRNEELQWYQEDNAKCDGLGNMVIEGRVERVKNPNYTGEGKWKTKREYAEYTSSSIITEDKYEFQYGTLVVRAKIPTDRGAWPAIWTLGTNYIWPSCGEVDVLEYYLIGGTPSILANTVYGNNTPWQGTWNSKSKPLSYFVSKDPDWTSKYHIWRMDWDENFIRLYLDDELMNETNLANTINGKNVRGEGEGKNAFHQPQYILLNLALGKNGGTPDNSKFPLKYYIDYVRVYQ